MIALIIVAVIANVLFAMFSASFHKQVYQWWPRWFAIALLIPPFGILNFVHIGIVVIVTLIVRFFVWMFSDFHYFVIFMAFVLISVILLSCKDGSYAKETHSGRKVTTKDTWVKFALTADSTVQYVGIQSSVDGVIYETVGYIIPTEGVHDYTYTMRVEPGTSISWRAMIVYNDGKKSKLKQLEL
jgi:hypothetical protein